MMSASKTKPVPHQAQEEPQQQQQQQYTVPPVAARWIAATLRRNVTSDSLVNGSKGLLKLSAIELKQVCGAIAACTFNHRKENYSSRMRSYKHATKPEMCSKIRMVLYSDFPTCQTENAAAMQELQTLTTAALSSKSNNATKNNTANSSDNNNSNAAVAGPAAARSASTAATPPASVYLPPAAAAAAAAAPNSNPIHGMSGLASFSGATATPPHLHHQHQQQTSSHKRNYNQAFQQDFGPALNAAMGMAGFVQFGPGGPAVMMSSSSSGTSNHQPRFVSTDSTVKPEKSDPETTPQNPPEVATLAALQQMGFRTTDAAEILKAHRRLQDRRGDGTHPAPDEVMMGVIEERERLEDEARLAADMDRARLESERSREEAAERRAQIQREMEQTIEQATMDTWMSHKHMFSQSWILQCDDVRALLEPWTGATTVTPFKKQLIQLLQLERDARKWYQEKLPRAYFVHVVLDRLRAHGGAEASLLAQLKREIDILQSGMYQLERQIGNVPIIFRDALDALDENEDDDEVELVKVADAPSSSTTTTTAKAVLTLSSPKKKPSTQPTSNNSNKSAAAPPPPASAEIIDLL